MVCRKLSTVHRFWKSFEREVREVWAGDRADNGAAVPPRPWEAADFVWLEHAPTSTTTNADRGCGARGHSHRRWRELFAQHHEDVVAPVASRVFIHGDRLDSPAVADEGVPQAGLLAVARAAIAQRLATDFAKD